MPENTNVIKPGQHWSLKNGDIALVIERNEKGTCWMADTLFKSGNFIKGLPTPDGYFKENISGKKAKEIAKPRFDEIVAEFLKPE